MRYRLKLHCTVTCHADNGLQASRNPIVFLCQSNGSFQCYCREYDGAECGSRTAAAPNPRQRAKAEAALPPLRTLLTLRRGGSLQTQSIAKRRLAEQPHGGRQSLCTRRDLPDSNLWSGRLGGRTGAPAISNVQIRAVRRQRRGVELSGRAASVSRHCRHKRSPRQPWR